MLRDLRYAVRTLLRSPGFTAVAVLTLALGIGATTAIFSVVDGVLLRPLPYPHADRLVMLGHHYPDLNGLEASISAPGFMEYRSQERIFEEAAAYTGWGANLAADGEAERVDGVQVTAGFFRTLGVSPLLGRGFAPEDEQAGADRVVLLSEDFWQRRFGGDPDVLGRSLLLNGEAYEVIGVVPAVDQPVGGDLWAPLAFTPDQLSDGMWGLEFLMMVARLRDGVSVDEARRHMAGVADAVRERLPGIPETWGFWFRPLHEQVVGEARPVLLVLLGAVGFVLLIACANVANLLLARATGRRREMALRTALGAGRGRLARQLITESGLLAVAGGAAGLLLAFWITGTTVALIPDGLPRADRIGVDLRVIGFSFAITLLAGLAFGLLPSLLASRASPQQALRDGDRGSGAAFGRRGIRRTIIVAEIALALVLMVGAALMIQSFVRMQQAELGMRGDDVLTMRVSLTAADYPEPERRTAFFSSALRELESLPGARYAGATTSLPLTGWIPTRSFVAEGYEPPPGDMLPWGEWAVVTPGYFEALGIPLLRGRTFSSDDMEQGRAVAVVDARLAERFWPGEDPIGRGINFPGQETRYEVVGVVGSVATRGPHAEPRTKLYLPLGQPPQSHMFVVVRGTGDVAPLANAARAAIARVDPNQPVYRVRPMSEYMARTLAPSRFAMLLLTGFAALALLLAGIGVYGVMAYAVAQRTNELGIRMALGADAGRVLGMVVGQTAKLALAGAAIGLVAALLLTRLLAGMLYGIASRDPVTFILVPVFLLATALLAGYLPARRATRIDPMIAMRVE